MIGISAFTVSDRLDAALACHQGGQHDAAEALYRAVLDDNPREPEALNLLGLLLQDRGELAASADLISTAISIDPEYAEAHANLARVQRALGDAVGAMRSAQRAIDLQPELAEAHLLLGRLRLDTGNLPQAVVSCQQALALDPHLPDGLMTLATAFGRSGQHEQAAAILRRILAGTPDNVTAMRALAMTLRGTGQFDEAIAWHRRSIECAPGSLDCLTATAVTLGQAQRIDEAAETCRAALALDPENAGLWTMLGGHAAALGEFKTAARRFEQALRLDPDFAEARRELVAIGQAQASAGTQDPLRAILADADRPAGERITAAFALGALLDQRGEYDAAFRCFADANRLAQAEHAANGQFFDRQAFRVAVDRLIAAFPPGVAAPKEGDGSELPVFIVGMPRSGTTLVEQIAASHPLVFGAGERKDIPAMLDRLTGGDHARPPQCWSPTAIHHETAAHIARLRAMAPKVQRITDKLPDNIQALGHISVLFPNARVVLCRRDPRDTCLSCHTQRFAEPMLWAHDLGDCAARTRQIRRLGDYWQQTLPLRILELHYEELVADLEGQSRRLIDFLGLTWDPACLAFHRTARPVLTASRWQVRQPVYSSSIGRWRNYRVHLQPLLDGLAGLVDPD